VHFIPIHIHPYYRDRYAFRPDSFPVAYQSYQRMLSLPLSAGLSDRDAGDVIEAVLDVVRSHQA
jgi:dTDP-4-amino-4,6-dideoxygalactose transaminase